MDNIYKAWMINWADIDILCHNVYFWTCKSSFKSQQRYLTCKTTACFTNICHDYNNVIEHYSWKTTIFFSSNTLCHLTIILVLIPVSSNSNFREATYMYWSFKILSLRVFTPWKFITCKTIRIQLVNMKLLTSG